MFMYKNAILNHTQNKINDVQKHNEKVNHQQTCRHSHSSVPSILSLDKFKC